MLQQVFKLQVRQKLGNLSTTFERKLTSVITEMFDSVCEARFGLKLRLRSEYVAKIAFPSSGVLCKIMKQIAFFYAI